MRHVPHGFQIRHGKAFAGWALRYGICVLGGGVRESDSQSGSSTHPRKDDSASRGTPAATAAAARRVQDIGPVHITGEVAK